MTFHLNIGGVKLPTKSALKKWVKALTKTTAFGQIMPKVAMAGIMLGTLPINALATQTTEAYNLIDYTVAESTVTIDTNKAYPITLVTESGSIELALGESKVDETARKEREAAAVAAAKRVTISAVRTAKINTDPGYAMKHDLVLRAAAAYNIPWEILEAVWQIESGMSWDRQVSSSAGAQGPAQFMPGTWRGYGVDADGDGIKNINGAVDAIHGAANYLAAGGANRGEIYKAIFNYNHADWYVQKVLRGARELGYNG